MLTTLFFLSGFVLLIKGADLLVEGASSLAKKIRISEIVIGLTIVAFGTSAPELVVNIVASIQGKADIAVSNVIGSNIVNTLLALGITAIIANLTVKRNTVYKEIPFSLIAVVLIFLLANDSLFFSSTTLALSRLDGFVLLLVFSCFMIYTFRLFKIDKNLLEIPEGLQPIWLSVIYILLGLVGLTLGGQWIVEGAVTLAQKLGITESLIGLTIVAIGTSFPEIATCIVATRKGKTDIAIGNVVGSNIFNTLWILGCNALIHPLSYNSRSNIDLSINLLSSLILFGVLITRNKTHLLKRKHGIIFVLLYLGYMIYAAITGTGLS